MMMVWVAAHPMEQLGSLACQHWAQTDHAAFQMVWVVGLQCAGVHLLFVVRVGVIAQPMKQLDSPAC